MTDKQIRERMVNAGIKNVTDYGYTNINKINIFGDYVLNRLFLSMLRSEENCGLNLQIERVRLALIKEVEDHVKSAA